jgi:hypothetical protein
LDFFRTDFRIDKKQDNNECPKDLNEPKWDIRNWILMSCLLTLYQFVVIIFCSLKIRWF